MRRAPEPRRPAQGAARGPGRRAVERVGQSPGEKLDRIAEVLTFREDMDRIRQGLEEVGIEPLVMERLVEATREGAFNEFRGAAHISAQAARNIIPGSFEVLLYDLTSTYSDPPFPEGDKRRHGYSRDHRPDCVQGHRPHHHAGRLAPGL